MPIDLRDMIAQRAAAAADPSAPRCHSCAQPLKHADEVRHNGGYCYACGPGSAKWQQGGTAPPALAQPLTPREVGAGAVFKLPGGAQLAPDLGAALAQLAAAAAAHGLRALVEFSPTRPAPAPAAAAPLARPAAPAAAPDLGAMPSTDCPACFVEQLGHTGTDEEHTCGRPAASVAPDAAGAPVAASEPAPAPSTAPNGAG